jgi:hypothetical protein
MPLGKPRSGPTVYAEHLTRYRYHPRSNRHGDCLCQAVVLDLVAASPVLRAAGAARKLVYDTNFNIEVANSSVADQLPAEVRKDLAWNMDLVLGPPAGSRTVRRRPSNALADLVPLVVMDRAIPSEPWLVMDAKGGG